MSFNIDNTNTPIVVRGRRLPTPKGAPARYSEPTSDPEIVARYKAIRESDNKTSHVLRRPTNEGYNDNQVHHDAESIRIALLGNSLEQARSKIVKEVAEAATKKTPTVTNVTWRTPTTEEYLKQKLKEEFQKAAEHQAEERADAARPYKNMGKALWTLAQLYGAGSGLYSNIRTLAGKPLGLKANLATEGLGIGLDALEGTYNVAHLQYDSALKNTAQGGLGTAGFYANKPHEDTSLSYWQKMTKRAKSFSIPATLGIAGNLWQLAESGNELTKGVRNYLTGY